MNHPSSGSRRRLIIGMAAAGLSGPAGVNAQMAPASAYPARAVRWLVPFAPGAANDIIARLFAKGLAERLGQSFVVENRAGAGGSIGAAAVATAAPDGHTLLLSNPGPNVATPMLSREPPYRVDAFESVIAFGYVPLIIVAPAGFAAHDPASLLAWLRANPGKANWGSSGNLSNPHIALELFRLATGTDITHVPYKGSGPALNDLIAGQIQLMHTSMASVETQVASGRLKVIGVASPARVAELPQIPTLAEAGIRGAESVTWFGLSVPAGTPAAVIATLNRACNAILETPDVRTRLAALGVTPVGGTPAALEALMRRDVDALNRLITAQVLRPT
jgi:tripartite-type tricarboxylate transporter receptor subunit TctC